MKILLSPPNSADSRHQSQQQIATVSDSQLNHYLKLHAAQQQQQQQQQNQSPLALLKRDPAAEDSKLNPGPHFTTVADSSSIPRRYNHISAAPKTEVMPSSTNVITSNLSATQTQQQQQHRHFHQSNGNSHHVVETTSTKPRFSTTPNQPPLPHKKLIMGKIEHNEAMENEAAMQQHAHSLLQLSQEPLVLSHNQRSSSPPTAQILQDHHHLRNDKDSTTLQQSRPGEELVYHQKLRDSSVGYFMEVGPTTTPSIHLTAASTDGDNTRSAENSEGQQIHHRQLQQHHYGHSLLQSRIFPKDEPMSPRSMASSPLASGSASPRSPVGNNIGAVELTQRLAAKGLLPQQPSLNQHIQHLQQQQQVVISPAETLVISTSALDGENFIVSSANSPTSTVAVTTGTSDIPQTKIPGTTVYEGECGFRISFAPQMKETKSAQWTYSSMLHKLFTRINAACPIRFQCAYKLPPSGTVLRALPIYMQPEHMCEAVVRCPVHAASPPDLDALQLQQQHQSARSTNQLIRADHPHAEYTDADPQYGRQSVCVPFEAPAVGTQWSTVLYRYMCNSSCAGGMNRRPIQTVFTLETPAGEVIGRQVVEVRICACPGRDSKVEERNVLNKGAEAGAKVVGPKVENGYILDGPLPTSSSSSPLGVDSFHGPGRKRKRATNEIAHNSASHHHDEDETPNGSQGGDDRVFTLLVRGRESFELLKRIRDSITLSKMASNDQLDQLQAMNAEMEQQINAASSLISFMSQPAENGHGGHNEN